VSVTTPSRSDFMPSVQALLEQLPIAQRRLRAGDVLFHRHDPGDAAQVVVSGMVGLEVHGATREPLIALLLRSGDVAAAARIVSPGTTHEVTARAITDCHIRLVRRVDVEAAGAVLEARLAMAEVVVAHNVLLLDRLIEAAHLSASARVASAVCRIAGDDDVAAVSQETIAAVAGVVRVTANAELKRLADRRLVRVGRRQVIILDRERLERTSRS
jgi:CRP-like cAMP-binding protein